MAQKQQTGFDVAAARKAGYSDDEILAHLTQTRQFDVKKALGAGYSKADVINYLSTSKPPAAGVQPPPGTPEVQPPKFLGPKGPDGRVGRNAPVIMQAPPESGLETGPLVSIHPEENDTLAHGAGTARFIARTLNAMKNTALETPPALYHAAVDKPQDSEQAAEETGAEAANANLPPVLSRLLYRTMVKPVTNAAEDYASGRVTPEAAASVSPEALGNSFTNVIGGKVLGDIGGTVLDKLTPKSTVDILGDTYSKPGDHIAASLRSNARVDVPAEAANAHAAIEEGLADRGFSTQDFNGRQGPHVLKAGLDNALRIQEARAKQIIDPIRGETVDPETWVENPDIANRLQSKGIDLKKATYGDIDDARIEMNKELRRANYYSKDPTMQNAVGDPLASTEQAVQQARNLVYNKAEQVTGVDLRPLKNTESSLLKLTDIANTTANTLSGKGAAFEATPLGTKIGQTVKGIVNIKSRPVSSFFSYEAPGLESPFKSFNSNMQKAFPNLSPRTADTTVSFPKPEFEGFMMNKRLGEMQPVPSALDRLRNQAIPPAKNFTPARPSIERIAQPEKLQLTPPEGETPAEPNRQESLPLSGGETVPGEDLKLAPTPTSDIPPIFQRVLPLEEPGVPSPLYPGVKK